MNSVLITVEVRNEGFWFVTRYTKSFCFCRARDSLRAFHPKIFLCHKLACCVTCHLLILATSTSERSPGNKFKVPCERSEDAPGLGWIEVADRVREQENEKTAMGLYCILWRGYISTKVIIVNSIDGGGGIVGDARGR